MTASSKMARRAAAGTIALAVCLTGGVLGAGALRDRDAATDPASPSHPVPDGATGVDPAPPSEPVEVHPATGLPTTTHEDDAP